MKLDKSLIIVQLINNRDREGILHYLAKENVVPVKAPSWADYSFELRRNEKTLRGQTGKHFISKEMTQLVLDFLGVRDEQSCKAVRDQIKWIR